jgi:hypothetical protein
MQQRERGAARALFTTRQAGIMKEVDDSFYLALLAVLFFAIHRARKQEMRNCVRGLV